nr:MAG TPA: hypothetical protein [Caudoviricetes sp.]
MHIKLLKFTLIAPYLPLFIKKRLGSPRYQVDNRKKTKTLGT